MHARTISVPPRHLSARPPSALTPAEVAPPATTPLADTSPADTPASAASPTPESINSPDYWPRKWLSTPPSPVASVMVPFPEHSPDEKPNGWVILEVFIGPSGHVDKIEILSAEAPNEFIEAAREAFLSSTFTPGLKDNVAVPSRIKIEVRYE